MSLYAIADTHLSFGTNKPMDNFYGWNDYVNRLTNNWKNLINDDDTIVIAGDISWAMNFNELYNDFDFLNRLPGNKIIIKGNHDFWWETRKKMNAFIEKNNFSTIKIIHNDSILVGDVAVCGSRGWMIDSETEQDEKVLNREVARLSASIDYQDAKEKMVFIHYPPIYQNEVCEPIVSLLKEKGIKKCYYGHLHGVAATYEEEKTIDDISYKLISADRLSFIPFFVKK